MKKKKMFSVFFFFLISYYWQFSVVVFFFFCSYFVRIPGKQWEPDGWYECNFFLFVADAAVDWCMFYGYVGWMPSAPIHSRTARNTQIFASSMLKFDTNQMVAIYIYIIYLWLLFCCYSLSPARLISVPIVGKINLYKRVREKKKQATKWEKWK